MDFDKHFLNTASSAAHRIQLSEDAGIEPRRVATFTLAAYCIF